MNIFEDNGELTGFQNWKLYLGNSWSDALQTVASAHESAHRLLEMTSVYGQVQLSLKNILPHQDNYYALEWLKSLFYKNSKFAHETFATWIGISVGRQLYPDIQPNQLLSQEYQDFYFFANQIIGSIPGYDLNGIVLMAVIWFCFQSEQIGLSFKSDFAKVRLDEFHPLDYPDNRLENILNSFNSDFFKNELDDLMNTWSDEDLKTYFINGNKTDFDINNLTPPVLQKVTGQILSHFFNVLDTHFCALGSCSLPQEALLDVVNGLYKKFHELSEEKGIFQPGQLLPLTLEGHEMRLKILEDEEMVFNREPVSAKIIEPWALTNELRHRLLKNNALGDTSIFLLTIRHSSSITQDYHFSEPADVEWLEKQNKILVHHLINVTMEGKDHVWLVPFASLKDILDFTYKLPYKTEVNAIFYQHVAAYSNFMKEEFDVIAGYSENFYFLTELTPLSMIEGNFFNDNSQISYCDLYLNFEGRNTCIGLLFEIVDTEATPFFMVMPAGNYHSLMIATYLEQHPLFAERKQSEMIDAYDQAVLNLFFYNLRKTYSFKYQKPLL